LNVANLMRAVRSDGVIVKPDAPLVPLDDIYLADAQGNGSPMMAYTYTAFGALRALYVFAYQRGADTAIAFTPPALSINGPAYLYNYFTGQGTIVDGAAPFHDQLADRAYYVVAPIGPSGIAFLGDSGHYVSLGKKRITSLRDDGVIEVSVAFAAGEGTRTLFG